MNKLRAKIVERGFFIGEFLKSIGMSRTKWYHRCSRGMGDFSIEEVLSITKVLDLTNEEILEIFLT